jgi:hypothetical protein
MHIYLLLSKIKIGAKLLCIFMYIHIYIFVTEQLICEDKLVVDLT